MADPAFAQKLVIEQALAAGSNLYWEYRQRGSRFFQCAPCCQLHAGSHIALHLASLPTALLTFWDSAGEAAGCAGTALPWASCTSAI